MDLNDYRKKIDEIDGELVRLFKDRMDVACQIALYKKEHGLPVLDAAREKEKLAAISGKAGEELQSYVQKLFSTLFELSRAYQESYT